MVSFTFDDFPRSALKLGGAILRDNGVTGTYYASMGLMNQITSVGPQFTAEDLRQLLEDGHELGSHTFSHVSGRQVAPETFEGEAKKGKEALAEACGTACIDHFSYPFGHATMRIKQRIGTHFRSCRGIVPGINISPVDLNLLRANSLYAVDLKAIGRLLDQNEKHRGWLIFYTHDVSSCASDFGCTPQAFESVVRMTVKRNGTRIVRMRDGVAGGTECQ